MTTVAVDVGVALTAIVSIALITSQIEVSGSERALDAPGYAAIGLAGTALAFRRRHPLVSVTAVTVALAVYAGRATREAPSSSLGCWPCTSSPWPRTVAGLWSQRQPPPPGW